MTVRLAMLAHLIWQGHSRWMLRSGLWWRLLTNDRSRILTTRDIREDPNEVLTAGEYVSKWSTKGQGLYSSIRFALDVQWIKMEEQE